MHSTRGPNPDTRHDPPPEVITERLRACCAAPDWVAAMLTAWPYATPDAALHASEEAFANLDWAQIELALAAHPRLGDRPRGEGVEAASSRAEQSALGSDAAIRAELAEANAQYERVFDRVFLSYADGRGAADILAELRDRLTNDEETERRVVRRELGKIVALRLRRWLG
ncbi:2-oxo-4-hydroxy-4-carboxy-5-ureidoimidazoline decarboxylase [Sciscionella marina]|uniref:2-oxo-4-hydroxy-4-carboxy-5-ureidoimidazoline decarboxylase n=1 Tax=Sciscionella marina TaxID=508770 RepID=UPI000371B6A7|nr:2-oxo-4-hydroxy-4-carboxy-5-ureidoimidazoline decarboxylase [Sciscionella marina]